MQCHGLELAQDGQLGQDRALSVLDGIEDQELIESLLVLDGELRAAGFQAVGAGAGVDDDGQVT